MEIALYQPDIPGNVGAILRLGACFGVPVHVIEPCGFAFSAREVRRSGMDYADKVEIIRHPDWNTFLAITRERGQRIALLTTKGATRLPAVTFSEGDILLFGCESKGVPEEVHDVADLRVVIPMRPGLRSLNVAVSAGIALSEGLRQTNGFPET